MITFKVHGKTYQAGSVAYAGGQNIRRRYYYFCANPGTPAEEDIVQITLPRIAFLRPFVYVNRRIK